MSVLVEVNVNLLFYLFFLSSKPPLMTRSFTFLPFTSPASFCPPCVFQTSLSPPSESSALFRLPLSPTPLCAFFPFSSLLLPFTFHLPPYPTLSSPSHPFLFSSFSVLSLSYHLLPFSPFLLPSLPPYRCVLTFPFISSSASTLDFLVCIYLPSRLNLFPFPPPSLHLFLSSLAPSPLPPRVN